MDKKKYLCKYHNIQLQIERKKEYIQFCDERSYSISSPCYDEPRVDHTPSYEAPFVRWLFKKAEAEEELEELEKKAIKVKLELESVIATVNDECLEMILNYRYIDWLSLEEICDKVHWSLATVKRKHEKALEKIEPR